MGQEQDLDLNVSAGEVVILESDAGIRALGDTPKGSFFRIRINGPATVTLMRAAPREPYRNTVVMALLYAIFYVLEKLSIAYYVRGFLVKHRSRWASAQFMDSYILGWLTLEFVLYIIAPQLSPSILLGVALYRLVEVSQAYVNVLVFHRLRHDPALGPYRIVSHWRTFVLGVLNLMEGAALFGLIDFAFFRLDNRLFTGSPIKGSWDALYFSFVTLTTVGYGDVVASGAGRLLAAAEAVWGVLFGIALLGRFVSALPSDRSLEGTLT